MYIVGIDFGHGETSAAIIDPQNVAQDTIPVKDLKLYGGEKVIPSIICKNKYNNSLIICPETRDFQDSSEIGIYFKDPLISSEKYPRIITEKKKYFFGEFIKKAFTSILKDNNSLIYDSENQITNFRLYIACPSGWEQSQIEAYKTFVNDLGLPVEAIVEESRAAYIASRHEVIGGVNLTTENNKILVIDLGSSTADFTYFDGSKVVHEGYPCGGSKVEYAIFNYMKENEKGAQDILNKMYETCEDKDKIDNAILYKLRKSKEEFYSKRLYAFESRVQAQEVERSNLYGRNDYFQNDGNDNYTKDKVNSILAEYIEELRQILQNFKEKEEVSEIDAVILTGGASQMDFFEELVCEEYGLTPKITCIKDDNPSTTISRGIATFGYIHSKSKPAKDALEEKLNETWGNQIWVQNFLRDNINQIAQQIYKREFEKIIDEYIKGNVKYSTNHTLKWYIDKIVAHKKIDGNEKQKRYWLYVENGFKYKDDNKRNSNKSIHALCRKIIDFIENSQPSAKAFDLELSKEITRTLEKDISQHLSNYVSEYYGNPKDIDLSITIPLDIKMNYTSSDVQEYIIQLVESLFDEIERMDTFGATLDTFHKNRIDYRRESHFKPILLSVTEIFCKSLSFKHDLTKEAEKCEETIKKKVDSVVADAEMLMYKF